MCPFQGDVTHIYAVGRSATAVNLKVNGQLQISSTVNISLTYAVKLVKGQAKFQHNSMIDAMP